MIHHSDKRLYTNALLLIACAGYSCSQPNFNLIDGPQFTQCPVPTSAPNAKRLPLRLVSKTQDREGAIAASRGGATAEAEDGDWEGGR